MLTEKRKNYLAAWRERNRGKLREYSSEWHSKNKNRVQRQTAGYRQENKEKILSQRKVYYAENRGRVLAETTGYAKNNRAKVNVRRQRYHLRKKNDPEYFLPERVRGRLRAALKAMGKPRPSGALDFLGCSILELRSHLESQFLLGMSWDNYGYRGWHIDHIRPLSSFDLGKAEELKRACHYTNLQPLWAVDNMQKGSKTS